MGLGDHPLHVSSSMFCSDDNSPYNAATTPPQVQGFHHRDATRAGGSSSVAIVHRSNAKSTARSEKLNEPSFSTLRSCSNTASGKSGGGCCCVVEKVELQRLLHAERAMRLAAERRTLEECERGVRNVIIVEATYGARLLYSILLEGAGLLPPSGGDTNGSSTAAWKKSPVLHRSQRPRRPLTSPARDAIETLPTVGSSLLSCARMADENRILREQVERYKSIDTADRREINELHRNMQAAIHRLTRERDALHAEFSSRKPHHNVVESVAANGARVLPLREGSPWHLAHLIDPFAQNMEESPDMASRLRVLPMQ